MKAERFFLLTVFILVSTIISGQNKFLISVCVADKNTGQPVSDVNVIIQNSWIGASTTTTGSCRIIADDLPVNLVLSHLAYKTKVLTITKKDTSDTVFCYMEAKPIELDEINVSAKANSVFKQPRYLIFDFDILDGRLLILERYKYLHNNHSRLILTDELLKIRLVCDLPSHINPVCISKDCLKNCHIVASDTVYQVIYTDNSLTLGYPVEVKKFNEIIKDCLFSIEDQIFFQRVFNGGYSYEFYSINVRNKAKKTFLLCSDHERMRGLQKSIKFLASNPPEGVPLGIAMYFERKVMFKPVKQELINLSDTIFLFNHHVGTLEVFTKNGFPVRTVNIAYHLNSSWKYSIYIDNKLNKAFTIISDGLYEINMNTGRIDAKTRIGMVEKIRINNGQLYMLKKKHAATTAEKYIERVQL